MTVKMEKTEHIWNTLSVEVGPTISDYNHMSHIVYLWW